MSADKTRVVLDLTAKKVEKLDSVLKKSNHTTRTGTLVLALDLLDQVQQAALSGQKIYIGDKEKELVELRILGLVE